MVNPVVDVIVGMDGDERAATKTMRVIPIYPASQKAGLELGAVAGVCRGAATRGGVRRPARRPLAERLGLEGRTEAMRGHPPARPRWATPRRRASRLVFDELFRLQLSLVARKAALAKDARGIAHPANPADALTARGALAADGASLVARFLVAPRLRASPARSAARSPSCWPTSRRRCRCTGCCRATWARARPSSRWPPCSPPSTAAARGRSWCRPRCSPTSTPTRCARCCSSPRARTTTEPARRDAPGVGRAAHRAG